jgi:hypothetical protein
MSLSSFKGASRSLDASFYIYELKDCSFKEIKDHLLTLYSWNDEVNYHNKDKAS